MGFSPETKKAHRARWFAINPGQDPVRRTSLMHARDQLGWDVVCSCGWESRTGGGIQAYVQQRFDQHREDAEFDATHTWTGRDWVPNDQKESQS